MSSQKMRQQTTAHGERARGQGRTQSNMSRAAKVTLPSLRWGWYLGRRPLVAPSRDLLRSIRLRRYSVLCLLILQGVMSGFGVFADLSVASVGGFAFFFQEWPQWNWMHVLLYCVYPSFLFAYSEHQLRELAQAVARHEAS